MSNHPHIHRTLAGACTAAALAFLPALAAGQVDPALETPARPFFIGLDAGAAIPGAELNDLADPGFTIGGELGWQATHRVAFKIEGAADMLRDQPAVQEAPQDMRLFHYGAGLEILLTEPDAYRSWDVAAVFGGGATTIYADLAAPADPTATGFTETYPRANAGLALSFEPTTSVAFELRGQAYVAFADEDETAALTDPLTGIDPLDRAVTYPITLAIDWRLPSM